jgi:hypothetical protein
VSERFSLHQFSQVLHIRNTHGRPYLLIGGQAVNYWAERYLTTEPELGKLIPFTSEDIDFKGTRADVEHIARELNLRATYPPKVQLTALAGAIPITLGHLKSNIEVVRVIPGVKPGSLEALAVEAEWGGKQIRVMDPVSLMACKLRLALTLPQDKRQDVAHLKILVLCVRGFLREFLHEVERGAVPAAGWLGATRQLLKMARSTHGRKAVREFGLNWRAVLPMDDIQRCQNVKVARFKEQQLARWPHP